MDGKEKGTKAIKENELNEDGGRKRENDKRLLTIMRSTTQIIYTTNFVDIQILSFAFK